MPADSTLHSLQGLHVKTSSRHCLRHSPIVCKWCRSSPFTSLSGTLSHSLQEVQVKPLHEIVWDTSPIACKWCRSRRHCLGHYPIACKWCRSSPFTKLSGTLSHSLQVVQVKPLHEIVWDTSPIACKWCRSRRHCLGHYPIACKWCRSSPFTSLSGTLSHSLQVVQVKPLHVIV